MSERVLINKYPVISIFREPFPSVTIDVEFLSEILRVAPEPSVLFLSINPYSHSFSRNYVIVNAFAICRILSEEIPILSIANLKLRCEDL